MKTKDVGGIKMKRVKRNFSTLLVWAAITNDSNLLHHHKEIDIEVFRAFIFGKCAADMPGPWTHDLQQLLLCELKNHGYTLKRAIDWLQAGVPQKLAFKHFLLKDQQVGPYLKFKNWFAE